MLTGYFFRNHIEIAHILNGKISILSVLSVSIFHISIS
ncbi:hypothetical protein YPPY113_3021, partial [Yersinia pestis PY-113]